MAIMIKNPDAPATRKQLWLLHILAKEDTRDWRLTMQQASDKINELKQGNNSQHSPTNTIKQNKASGYHYCVMFSTAPSTHRMSNGKRKWKAFYTTKNKAAAIKQYNNELARIERNPSLYPTSQVVLVECKAASLARHMLQSGHSESIAKQSGIVFARIVKDSRGQRQ